MDLISRFPLVSGRVFYKLMTVDTKNGEIDDKILFEEFDVAIINQVGEKFYRFAALNFLYFMADLKHKNSCIRIPDESIICALRLFSF